MKVRSIVAALLLLIGLQSALAQTLKLYLSDKQVVEYSVEKVDSLVFTDGAGDTAESHEWVDLGLPSGTLWATCNVGANSPEEYGDYFAWGETESKDYYDWSTYKYCKGTQYSQTKYCTNSSCGTVDNKTELEPSDDAATVNWGSEWQMPSMEQCDELYNSSYTTTTWTTMNGKYGRKITSKSNGNSIFLPAAGYLFDTFLLSAGSDGMGLYWSRSLRTSYCSNAYYLNFGSGSISTSDYYRLCGQSVRPVRTNSAQTTVQKIVLYMEGNQTIECNVSELDSIVFVDTEAEENDVHEYVDLGLPSGTLWATCNVGANSPEEYGDYFAWGETEPKSDYSWSTYKYCKGSKNTMTKYCTESDYGTVDNKTELEPSDDAATVNWGSEWQMPSREQCYELINSSYTTTTWTTMNGKYGIWITSKSNGNSIFLPAAGCLNYTRLDNAGSYGYYWSHSLDTGYSYDACYLGFYSSGSYTNSDDRYRGRGVRPVRVKKVQAITVSNIELSQTVLSVMVGETSQLSATVLPDNASNKDIKWESSNAEIATVDQSGKVSAVAVGDCIITCSATDGSGVKAECQVTVSEFHEYIDLGLPSGTLWATCNVGASKPQEYGDYFAWGETEPKSNYSWSTYKYYNGTTLTKYCIDSDYGTVDNKTELEAIDDAATANWGSGWQMPSDEQLEELYNSSYTTTTRTTKNGVYGMEITSKSNGKSIFLPAAGYLDYTGLNDADSYGYYWSHSLYTNYSKSAYVLGFDSNDNIVCDYSSRCYGFCVRPVRLEKYIAVSKIELSQTVLSVLVGETTQLSATVLPENATNNDVKWESSNADVATVDQSGKVTSVAGGTCTITCSATDGSGVKAECQVEVVMNENRKYVDLGLPSGTLWATCNVGANSPEEYGDYFAWGETEQKSKYSWLTYKYCEDTYNTMTKYCTNSNYGTVDNKTELEPSDDAATVNWGSEWQMPSPEQCAELYNSSYTITMWTTLNGVNGRMIVSRSNGNSIFLPAAGFDGGTSIKPAGSNGGYWSRSLSTSYSYDAYCLSFSSSNIYVSSGSRCDFRSVRPVRVKK